MARASGREREREREREKHGERGRRTWRKLHLAVDSNSSEILASELTSNEVGDPSMVGPLLEQIPGILASLTADGAYDGEPVYRAVAQRLQHIIEAIDHITGYIQEADSAAALERDHKTQAAV